METIIGTWQKVAWFAGGLVLLGLFGHYVVFLILKKLATYTASKVDNIVVKHCYRPLQWILILFAARIAMPLLVPEEYLVVSKHALSLLLIGMVCWLIIKVVYVLQDYLYDRYKIDEKDNLRARKIRTQLNVLKRITIIIIGILALSSMLMTFDKVRQLGTTILASAGIIGIVVGMAAQRTIGTFIAGLQIAFTQPIRLDDVVIVENEWGRIEEITLTYVVVKIWDLRRLIVPITYFIEKPFQNWTRVTADLLGTVFIYVDYTVPVDTIRAQLQKILQDSGLWDGKVCVLQVTNTSEKTVELRALMSAPDASAAWNLRCHVREKLIEYMQKNCPESLPKFRASLKQLPEQ